MVNILNMVEAGVCQCIMDQKERHPECIEGRPVSQNHSLTPHALSHCLCFAWDSCCCRLCPSEPHSPSRHCFPKTSWLTAPTECIVGRSFWVTSWWSCVEGSPGQRRGAWVRGEAMLCVSVTPRARLSDWASSEEKCKCARCASGS